MFSFLVQEVFSWSIRQNIIINVVIIVNIIIIICL